ncbi:MAG: hypothetical protein WB988_10755 [Candidatus Nitrosopolaris sp.]
MACVPLAVLTIVVLSCLIIFSYLFHSNIFSQTNSFYNHNLISVKILVDRAIQSFQNNSSNNTISHLEAAYYELLMSTNNNTIKSSNIRTLVLLIGHTIKLMSENTVAKNNAIMYLSALEEQLDHYLPDSASYARSPKGPFLEYENEPYGLKVKYPYDWIIRINNNYSLPTMYSYAHPQIIGSFYLPNSTDGLPFFYMGVNNNLSKQLRQFPFTLQQYLNKSLLSKKNSSAFPDFNIIEATATNNSLAGFPAYEIVWTYKHPTYGMRKLVEFGIVVDGYKGYFVDYAASIEKFSKYLPIAQDMKESFRISQDSIKVHQ